MSELQKNNTSSPASTGIKNDLITKVLGRVTELKNTGGIHLPSDYSAANALQAAWHKLNEIPEKGGEALIKRCTGTSVANALFEMVIAGLNPMKRQCSFIPRGQVLTLQREYQGSIALARRLGGLKSITSSVVYAADNFIIEIDLETGRKKIKQHETSLEAADGEIKGAYAVVELEDGTRFCEIMTMTQIRKSWEQGPMKGNSPAHRNFPDQMAMKTVINRACKGLINSSDDGGLFDDDTPIDYVANAVHEEIAEKANTGEAINIDAVNVKEKPEPVNIDDAEEAEYAEAEMVEDSQTVNPGF